MGALKRVASKSIDLVFLDPPFEAVGIADAALAAAGLAVTDEGFIYLESPKALSSEDAEVFGLNVHRFGKAGMVHYHLLRKLVKETPQTP